MGSVKYLALLLLLAPVMGQAQQSAKGQSLPSLPSASLPLSGSEFIYLVQGNQDTKAPASSVGPLVWNIAGTWTMPQKFNAPLIQTPGTNPLTLSGNVTPGAPPLLSTLGTMLNLVGQDNINTSITINSFNKLPSINGQRANGTFAAPTQVIAGNVLMRIGGWGYRAAGDSLPAGYIPGHTGLMEVQSSESWVGNSNGTQISFWATPNGHPDPFQYMTLTNGGSLVLTNAGEGTVLPNVTSAYSIDDEVGNGIKTIGPLNIASSTPASASAPGVAGTIAWDANFIYVCVSTNSWKRVAVAAW